jgi:hypothetical protein
MICASLLMRVCGMCGLLWSLVLSAGQVRLAVITYLWPRWLKCGKHLALLV